MLETVFPMGYTTLEIKLLAITEFDHSCPQLLSIHTGPSFGKAYFLFVIKLSNRLSERQKQDDKTECSSMSKALRGGTV
jgi:hypothetical protein